MATGAVTLTGDPDSSAVELHLQRDGDRRGRHATEQAVTLAIGDVDEFDIGAVSDTVGAAGARLPRTRRRDGGRDAAFATDADATSNVVTYSLSSNPGGLFAIDATTGIVTVADGALIDYEAAASHTITVMATSADGSSSSRPSPSM